MGRHVAGAQAEGKGRAVQAEANLAAGGVEGALAGIGVELGAEGFRDTGEDGFTGVGMGDTFGDVVGGGCRGELLGIFRLR